MLKRKIAAVTIVVSSFAGLALAGPMSGPKSELPSRLDPLHSAQLMTRSCGADCPTESPFTCYDSDGYYPYGQGTVTIYYLGQFYASFTDYCLNSQSVREYWCDSGQSWTYTDFFCTNGCSAGACP